MYLTKLIYLSNWRNQFLNRRLYRHIFKNECYRNLSPYLGKKWGSRLSQICYAEATRVIKMDYDSDEEMSQLEKLRNVKVPKGMHVSGWDDDADELIEEDKNPQESLDRMILWAVNENKIGEVREILQVDPEAVHSVDSDGYTPLHRACYNNFIDIAKLLIRYNANVNAKTNLGWTPLHSACKWGRAEAVALLLKFGADVNAVSDGLQTPLHVAATVSNCRDIITLLLTHRDIKPNALNNSEETAADIARRTGMTYPVFKMGHPAYRIKPCFIE